jgi:serine/threonine protein kinase/tetratricopeptide (TPR) repeat protein
MQSNEAICATNMTPERWQQVKEIFNSAIQYEPEERAAFLSRACGGDEALRKEVESLLAAHEKEGSFIDSPAYQGAAKMLESDQELKSGQTIGHYEILSTLGRGGMGEVYLAMDSKLGRKVALKFLSAYFTRDKDRLRRFEQEARATSALNHPNILTIHEIGEADGRRFIATEFVDGETLRPRISIGPLQLGETLSIAEQAASALAAAHAVGIIHRDIKPENIMLRRDGIVKVLDFGLAKLLEEKQTGPEDATRAMVRTSTGVVMGTVTYMSPEQARGLSVDARTDIWSLGVVLYEMVAGRLPFAGETASDVISLVLQKEPPALTTVSVDIPERLDEIVTKALTKDREERYQTIKDLALDLKRLKQKLDIEAEIERTQAPELRNMSARRAFERAREGRATASSIEYLASRINVNKTGAFLVIVSLVILAVAVAYYFTQRSAQPIDSIAVLPFANAGGDPNTDYLSDGITESIINSLSQLPQLKVMARSTVFHFKGRDTDPLTVGKELGVRAVMTGRLSQQGDNLIVSAELVNVSDGTQLWGEQYNRRMSDLAVLQQDISREITDRLRLRLSGEQQRQLNKGGTNNTGAYQLFLRGRYYERKGTGDDFRKAIGQFQQATERDPNYALAYVGLADGYLDIGAYIGTPTREILPQARVAVERALQIDDSLSEAHAALAHLYHVSLLWEQSEKEYQRAISLNPKVGHWEFANLLRCQMRYDEALREIKRAQELDPLYPLAGAIAAFIYRNLGDADASIRESKRVIALDPNYPVAHVSLGLVYMDQRRYEEAIAELQKAVELSGRGSYTVSTLGAAYAASGRHAEALAILRELEEKYARHEANGTDLAILRAGLGDSDQAITWLEKDLDAGNTAFLVYVTNTYVHDRLYNDARYRAFLRRMGLTVQ